MKGLVIPKAIITYQLSQFISKWSMPYILSTIRKKNTDIMLLSSPQGG
jgi:hypothetical protein